MSPYKTTLPLLLASVLALAANLAVSLPLALVSVLCWLVAVVQYAADREAREAEAFRRSIAHEDMLGQEPDRFAEQLERERMFREYVRESAR